MHNDNTAATNLESLVGELIHVQANHFEGTAVLESVDTNEGIANVYCPDSGEDYEVMIETIIPINHDRWDRIIDDFLAQYKNEPAGYDLSYGETPVARCGDSPEMVRENVEEILKGFQDSPEIYGLPFLIYTADIRAVWKEYESEVEQAMYEYGLELGDYESISEAIEAGVYALVDQEYRVLAQEALGDLDDLVNELEEDIARQLKEARGNI